MATLVPGLCVQQLLLHILDMRVPLRARISPADEKHMQPTVEVEVEASCTVRTRVHALSVTT